MIPFIAGFIFGGTGVAIGFCLALRRVSFARAMIDAFLATAPVPWVDYVAARSEYEAHERRVAE